MMGLDLYLRGDGAWADLQGREDVTWIGDGTLQMAVLEGGMVSGAPLVAIRLNLGNGVVIMQTSAKLLLAAAQAIEACYPNIPAEGLTIREVSHR